MESLNKTAKELSQHYKKIYDDLVNTYCQARDRRPFDKFPEIAKAIWRMGVVYDAWHGIALKNAERRYYEGG